MSLINQALHKAQRDRTVNRMQPPGEQSPGAYANSTAKGMSPALVIGLIVAVAVLVGLVAGLSIVIFNRDAQPAPQQVAASQTQIVPANEPSVTTPESTTTTPTPVAPQKMAPAITTASTATTATAPVPSVVEELRKAREATEAEAAAQEKLASDKAAAESKIAEEARLRAEAQPSEGIIEWLSNARLSGVRISETGNRVILNGDAYTVGEYVNFTLGLKIMIIQETRVLFVDNNGKKYMKRL